jgi:hypothetical protein
MDDVIEVMKLLCYEMMDLQRTQAAADKGGGAAAAAAAGTAPNAAVVWQLLHRQADELVVLLTIQTHKVCLCVCVGVGRALLAGVVRGAAVWRPQGAGSSNTTGPLCCRVVAGPVLSRRFSTRRRW